VKTSLSHVALPLLPLLLLLLLSLATTTNPAA